MLLKQLAHDLLDFCYPGRCTVCDASIEQSVDQLCVSCLAEFDGLVSRAACMHCGLPISQPGAPCTRCEGRGLYPFERIVRLGVFVDPLKHLIHELKYHRKWWIADFLAKALTNHEPAREILQQTDVVVAVPLHPIRQVARGYNQAELIARRVAKLCDLDRATPAIRIRSTETQTHLHSLEKRDLNVRDAFGLVQPKWIAGKHVLLIDDVMTSGATLKSLARCLADAAPASLSAMTVAIADPKRTNFELI